MCYIIAKDTIAYKIDNLFYVDKSNTEGTVEALFNSMRL